VSDIDAQLEKIEDIFGPDLEDIPTATMWQLKRDIFEALCTIFSVRDEDLTLDGIDGDKAAIRAKAQAPYKAMAHMMVMLAKGVPETD
jgi:hypothetical protein